jgi:hypothetical protein
MEEFIDELNTVVEEVEALIGRNYHTSTPGFSVHVQYRTPTELSKHRTMPAWLTQGTPQSSGKPVGKH